MRMGTSALNAGVVKKLITAGVMDSMFEPGALLYEKLYAYENATEKASGKRLSKKERTARFYVDLNAMQRHQLRRQFLPIGKETILPIVTASGTVPGFYKQGNTIRLKPEGAILEALQKAGIGTGATGLQIIDDSQIPAFNALPVARGQGSVMLGTFLYINISKSFPIKRNGTTAWKVQVDAGCGGQVLEIVQWAPRRSKQKEPINPLPDAGSIVFAVLSRYGDKEASAELLHVISPAVATPTEEAKEAEGENDDNGSEGTADTGNAAQADPGQA